MEVVSKYHVSGEELNREQQLVEAAKRDPVQFKPLYNLYYERIYMYIWQRMDDKEKAHDVTSQVFLKAMTNLHKYQFRGVPFASWLYRIAKSEVYSVFRQEQAQRTVSIDTHGLHGMMEEIQEDPYEGFAPLLGDAVASLDEEDLQLIEMRFFEKRPFKEIAEILEITENNAKVKTYRILEKLRKKLIDMRRAAR
ncbi:MAG: sigma-70 family RNA polymerase sigma factor [Bacteroidia bacterium]|nr:sigma-70 family RNA polymerase sigma factor [Bacteroidia bacterium]